MRLSALLFTAILVASPSMAQPARVSASPEKPSANQDSSDTKPDKDAKNGELNLPVSLDKIREGLQQTRKPGVGGPEPLLQAGGHLSLSPNHRRCREQQRVEDHQDQGDLSDEDGIHQGLKAKGQRRKNSEWCPRPEPRP